MARILITSGATREPIDEVRFISNLSSGSTGAALADYLSDRGHEVHLLHGMAAVMPAGKLSSESFGSAADLEDKLRKRLGSGAYDAVIMCAAVADYRPIVAQGGKISSDETGLNIVLTRNAKILPQLKGFSPVGLIVVGFKFTVGADVAARKAAVGKQFASGGVDLVVHNDLREIKARTVHPFNVFRSPEGDPERFYGCSDLGRKLSAFIEVRRTRQTCAP